MRLVNYRCEKCGAEYEELLNDSELALEPGSGDCCGGKVVVFNFKNNAQRVRIFDKEGENT